MDEVFQKDLFDIDVLSVIYQIMAVKTYSERIIGCGHLGHEHFIGVIQAEPPVSFNPIKLAIDPDPQSELMSSCVILFAHKGIINISQAVILVKSDQQRSISYRDITGHISWTSGKGIRKQDRVQQNILRLLRKPIFRFPSAKVIILRHEGMVVTELK